MVEPGKYTAKVADWGFANKPDKDGNPIIEVHFDVEGQGSVRWSGFMNEKNINRTLESLLYMGFTSPDLSVLADGIPGGALNRETPVNIEVAFQQKKVDGKYVNDTKYTQVKWINKAGGVKALDPQAKAEVKTKLLNLNGLLAQKRQEFGVTTKKQVEL